MNSSLCNIIYQWNFPWSLIQLSQTDPLYILRGHRLYFPNTIVFLSLKISFVDLMASWIFKICQGVSLRVSSIYRVIHHYTCEKNNSQSDCMYRF